jgi:hypothetical protein
MKLSQKTLNSELEDFADKLERHIDGYLANLQLELETLVDGLKHDYESDKDTQLYQDLDLIFFKSKRSLSDAVAEFFGHYGDSEFRSMNHIKTDLESISDEIDGHLRDDDEEDKIVAYDSIKELAASYQLSDSQYHQDEILKLLESEFDLKLICLPAKNQ